MNISQLYQLYRQHPTITTDSRDCPKGAIFVALKGDSFNGNQFAQSALDKGCSYAVVDEAQFATESDERFILVDDCLSTLQQLAREHRRQFDIPIVGITGTNGKTTTKELITCVLGEKLNVLATEGNFNNDIGVPKTLFRLNGQHEIAVVEMGASHPGDIKRLVETAEPTCGLITNVGMAHLQGFGSFEGVKRTKGELYDFLGKHDATVFVNHDNEHLMDMSKGLSNRLFYGQNSPAKGLFVRGEVVSCSPLLSFRWRVEQEGEPPHDEWTTVETHLIGAYNLDNMLAAITVGLHFGVEKERIVHALANYVPSNNRSQLEVTERNKLIVDAYNANPTSMRAAIDNFKRVDAPKKMVILGDMRELGAASDEAHQQIVELLEQCHFDKVWLVGDNFAKANRHFRTFGDVEAVKAALQEEPIADHFILVKGSNSIRLAQLPQLL